MSEPLIFNNKKQKNKMSSDMRSVPDLTVSDTTSVSVSVCMSSCLAVCSTVRVSVCIDLSAWRRRHRQTDRERERNRQTKQVKIIDVVVSMQSDANTQNPLHTFPRNFHVDGEVASLLRTSWHADKSATSWQQVVVMEFGKRHYTTDTTAPFKAFIYIHLYSP